MLKQRGTLGIRGLARLFKIMDNNGNRQLDINEFGQGLAEHGIGLNQEQVQTIFNHFDRNKNGQVDFDEFLRAIRVWFFKSLKLLGRFECVPLILHKACLLKA